MDRLVLASNNKKKLAEMQRILAPMGFDVVTVSQAGFEPEEIEENGSTFAENAFIKAQAVCKLTKMAAIADDSGLCVDYLDGAPGLYSARFGGEGLSDKERYELLLKKLSGVKTEDRGAYFMCAICCVFPSGEKITAEGRCNGFIATEPCGEGGFGYDPVFLLPDGRCYAVMTAQEKDEVSHRGRALRLFAQEIKGRIN